MFRLFRTRKTLQKWVLAFFLGVVSVGMVLVLAPLPGGDVDVQQPNMLAAVGDATITTQDLQKALQERQRSYSLNLDSRTLAALARPILDEMIYERALIIEAHNLGLQVTDQEVQNAAKKLPGIYQDGKFADRNVIEQLTGMTLESFVAELRQQLLVQKLRSVVTDGVRVSPGEVHREFIRQNTHAVIDYVVFDPTKFTNDVKVTPDALAAYFKQNSARYQVPEQRRVRYVLITPDYVQAQVKVSDDDVKRYYQTHLADYRVPDRVKVAHILFKTTGKSADEVKAIEKKAEDVLNQIHAGKDFAALARQYSEDTSAQQGGEIGWIVRGQTVKEFEDVAFSLQPGQVSGLVHTTYGIHIIKVEDKETAHLQTFAEVQDQIRQMLMRQKLADTQEQVADNLEAQFTKDPTKFAEVAKAAGLEVKETAPFSYRQVLPDFGNSESFANLSFQLRPGEVGQPITVPKGTVIMQLIDVTPPHVPTLDDVRAQVETDFRGEQSHKLAQQKAQELAAQAKSGDFKAVAARLGLKVQTSKEFTPQDSIEGVGPASALGGAFTLAPGQTSEVVSLGTNSVVFRVVSRTPPNEADFAAQKDQLTEQLLQQKRALAFEIFRQNLKAHMLQSGQLKLNDAALKSFIASYQRS